jgi:quercetin dioxygenase-like cupin family protein
MDLVRDLTSAGFAGPLPLYDPDSCASLLERLNAGNGGKGVWGKSRAVRSLSFYEAATDPRLLDVVRGFLGDNVILWGASLVVKRGTDVHPFHTDVESMDPDGGFVSVWIGLSNISEESGLKFIAGSHRYGVTTQQANHDNGVARADSTDETAVAAARRFDPEARIAQPDIDIGDALFFDGRVWHGSHNRSEATRTALLLQYARADRPVHIPARYDFPIEMRTDERPPVLLLSGKAPMGVNRLSHNPVRVAPNAAFEMDLPPPAVPFAFSSLPHFRGTTPRLTQMDAHSSILAPGQSPHPLHQHQDEEILVVLDGTAELSTAADGEGTGLTRTRMGPGDFAYYPAWQWHTLTNTSDRPILYTMFKWIGANERTARSGDELRFVTSGDALRQEPTDKYNRGEVLNVASRWLRKVHAHVSIMAGGRGYNGHADAYDVAIVLVEGAVETLDRIVRAPAVIFHPAQAPHGLRAAGEGPARYLVFEFHKAEPARPVPPKKPLPGKRPAPPSLARRAKNLIKRAVRAIAPGFAARRWPRR